MPSFYAHLARYLAAGDSLRSDTPNTTAHRMPCGCDSKLNSYVNHMYMQSKQDQTVKPACAEDIYHRATTARPKFLHWLEWSDYVVTMGVEQEDVFQLCHAFIATTIRDVAVETALPRDAHWH